MSIRVCLLAEHAPVRMISPGCSRKRLPPIERGQELSPGEELPFYLPAMDLICPTDEGGSIQTHSSSWSRGRRGGKAGIRGVWNTRTTITSDFTASFRRGTFVSVLVLLLLPFALPLTCCRGGRAGVAALRLRGGSASPASAPFAAELPLQDFLAGKMASPPERQDMRMADPEAPKVTKEDMLRCQIHEWYPR